MLSWFSKKPKLTPEVDIHSHLIPGIDDGSKSLEDSLNMIRELSAIGYKKIVTTPHIHPNYLNEPEVIKSGLKEVAKAIQEEGIEVEIECAAEYYVDEVFFSQVKAGAEILTFGNNYVLVESSFYNKPMLFESCLFELKAKGYQPVLAHPERYNFLEGKLDWLEQLKQMEIDFQVTTGSFGGYYGTQPQKIAKMLAKRDMIDFLGSDLHRNNQLSAHVLGLQSKEVEKLCKSRQLKNFSLL